jgi:hypothetical protein
VNFIFKNQEILTECVNNHEGFSLFNRYFGPYEEGKKYKIEFFVALPLIENDILKISPNERCDNRDVQRYAISERDEPQLKEWNNKYFLNRIMEFKRFTEKEINDDQRPGIDLDRFRSYMINIIDKRLTKLIKLARTELSLNDEKRLTASEIHLYELLNSLISQWRKFFLKNS